MASQPGGTVCAVTTVSTLTNLLWFPRFSSVSCMCTCNLLLIILANFFPSSSNLLIVLVHSFMIFPTQPFCINCFLSTPSLRFRDMFSPLLCLSSPPYANHVYCHVMFSVDFVYYLHTHDVLDSGLSHTTVRFAVDMLMRVLAVIDGRLVAN